MIVGAGNRLSAVGASNVNNIGVPPNIETDGFMYFTWQALAGRMTYHPQVAQGGETLSQTLSRVQDPTNGYPAHVANYGRLPSHAVIQAGRNDMIFATAADVETKLTTYEQILDYLLSQGILPIITATFPSDNATSIAQHQRNLVNFHMGLALMAQKKGLPFIDTIVPLIDTTTGGMQSAYEQDDLHPNEAGNKVVGQYISDKLLSGGFPMPWTPPLAYSNDSNSDDAYLLTNPLLLTDTNVDGTPDQWTKGGADSANLTNSLVSGSSDGILGNWLKMVKTTSTGDASNASASMSVTAGDWIAVGWAEKYVHTSGTPSITTRIRTSPGNTDIVFKKIQTTNAANIGLARHFQIVKIPASQTSITMSAIMNAVGEYYLGQVTILNLTAVGLDTWL